MASNNITITKAEKFKLEQKAKAGWRSYFIMRDGYDNISQFVNVLQDRNRVLRENLNDPNYQMEALDITYLQQQFIEMYDKLKEYTECPVCFELLTKDNIEVPKCGHTICKTCIETIKGQPEPKCPNCRKKY
jgi:hypothetical protein